ncbi:unnamed protein product [Brachionus calyciflorus]|uniref:WIF domain-containing protein n=1 Tax=Brachionus calyciflorus TaxID=104777 RepID=A0A814QHL6_9BILA|nr:unnamed protein product [Brachionus calyciflorus]
MFNFAFSLVLIVSILKSNFCYVDLFLNANETRSLFGYAGSLFYLFNGEIRANSIQHRLDIPDVKHKIEFNWKSTAPLQVILY